MKTLLTLLLSLTSVLAVEQTDLVVVGATPSGIAAAQAVSAKAELRAIDVPALQREILKRGGVILYEATDKRPEGL